MNKTLFITALLISVNALADESSIQLKAGAGQELVTGNCSLCHSLDYIPMNSGILDQQGWQKTVDKMINVMGAPIKPEDKAAIVAYLSKNYGAK